MKLKPTEEIKDRFFSKVEKTESCWLWRGTVHKNKGYGYFSWGGKALEAHRAIIFITDRDIPKGKQVDHICRVRNCVNPDHLRIVTPWENNILNSNGLGSLNYKKTHCKNGHEFTTDNMYSSEWAKRRKTCKTCVRIASKKTRERRAA